MPTSMNSLLKAILDDDGPKVKQLLQADAGLATRLIDEAKLYRSTIFHWIYVGDTALHLAAAGYRVEIVGLLLAAGADSTRPAIIVEAARCTTRRTVTSPVLCGMRKGK